MFVSIIIPLVRLNDYIAESIPYLLALDYPDFEILILPNEVSEEDRKKYPDPRIRLIGSGKPSPAFKRNLGAKEAKGEILAFLDDDAYPQPNWLNQAVKHFTHPDVAAVGGPAITPRSDGYIAQLSGAVYTSFLGSGGYRYRYWPGKKIMEVEDFPSVNLLVRTDIFRTIGGFTTDFWPGEDTKLCFDIIQTGKKILYDPAVVVSHHRRPLFRSHFKQVNQYARHRGYFMKHFPRTSLRLAYLIPTFFVAFILLTPILARAGGYWSLLCKSLLILYALLLLISGFQEGWRIRQFGIGLGVMPLMFATHVVYGIGVVKGLLKKNLSSTFRT